MTMHPDLVLAGKKYINEHYKISLDVDKIGHQKRWTNRELKQS